MPVSLVTPSTRLQTSSPNASRTSSSVALVSSTVSWSSAAQSVSVSSRRPAQIFATPTGMDDELLARLAPLVGVVLAGEEERLLDALAVDLDDAVVGVLLDDREDVAEEAALELGELRAAGLGARASPGARRGRPACGASLRRRRLRLRRRSRFRCRAGQESSAVLESQGIGPVGR